MKIEIPGYMAPVKAARVRIGDATVFLRPRDRWPIFEVGAPELNGLEGLMGPLMVDYPAPVKAAKKKDEKAAEDAGGGDQA